MDTHDILIMIGFVISAAIGTQLLAARLKLPSIVLLLGMGVLLGPEMLGVVDPNGLGNGLRIIIPLMVAVIVFEGGMALDLTYLQQVSRTVQKLVLLGCLITAVLAAIAARLFVGFSWPLALLFGALVSVTGPTVINPLLRRAAVKQRLKTILMAEGVLVDAVGAVLAVVVLEGLLVGAMPLRGAGSWFVTVVGGAVIGLGGGWLLGKGLNQVGREFTAELTRLSALGGALAIYTIAEIFSAEAGIAAAAAAGIVVGNMRFPYEEPVHHFKGDLTTLSIGVIFVLLAARLRFDELAALGWGGIVTVLVLMLVVRPASVFLSTIGTEEKLRDKIFISAVGPRGIVSASFATFAALRLEDAGFANSSALAGLVFMVIIGTVVIQSFTTPWMAKLLGVQPMLTMIIGADPLGRDLGSHLQRQNEEIVLIDRYPDNVAEAREQGLTIFEGDPTEERVLRKAGIERARALVATTASDKTNLMVCQLAKSRFGITELVARANSESLKAFTDLGIRAMSPTSVAVMVLDNLLRRPSTLRLLTDLDPGKEVREVFLHNGSLANQAVKDISLEGDVLISTIRRNGRLFVPHGNTILEFGDQVTFIGSRDDVLKVSGLFEKFVEVGSIASDETVIQP